MTGSRAMLRLGVVLVCSFIFANSAAAQGWAGVDSAFGRHGASLPGNVQKYGFPRGDLHVTVDGVTLRPALALGSWVAFKRLAGTQAMAMGDLVLLENEVAPVMGALRAAGIQQSALHNHLLRESPHVMYMHIMAMGDAVKLAHGIHDALARSATPLGTPPEITPLRLTLDTNAVIAALGVHGSANGGVYQMSVPRPETIRENGQVIPPAMGVATSINMQPTNGDSAVTTGDFVLLPSEVNGVIQALTKYGIGVTALHSHLLSEQPHVLFMHFWGNDTAANLARGLRAALDATAMAPGRARK